MVYSGTSLIRTPMGQKKVSLYILINACKSGIYLGWEKVSCLERYPQFRSVLIEREVLLYSGCAGDEEEEEMGKGVEDAVRLTLFLKRASQVCHVTVM